MAHVLAFGDSITQGYHDTAGGWPVRLWRELNTYYPGKHAVYNLGMDGDKTADVLVRFKSEFIARTRFADKMIVLLAVGTNDAIIQTSTGKRLTSPEDFESTYWKLLQVAKDHTEYVLAIGPSPIQEAKVNPFPWDTKLGTTQEAHNAVDCSIETLAIKANVSYLPLRKLGNLDLTLSDGDHLTDTGHELYMKTVFDKIVELAWV